MSKDWGTMVDEDEAAGVIEHYTARSLITPVPVLGSTPSVYVWDTTNNPQY